MTRLIKVKKGLDINLKGKPDALMFPFVPSNYYTIYPDDFQGFVPKVAVKIGDKVQAGSPVLYDKNHPELKIVSPVSGEISEINRGEKRKLLSVVIFAGKDIEYHDFGKKVIASLTSEEIKQSLAESGIAAFIRQRPYDIVANLQDTPRDIFVSAFYSAPLAPDVEYIMQGQEPDFQTGLTVLSKLTSGKVYLAVRSTCTNPCLATIQNVDTIMIDGPHPSGNASIQINHIKPVNKGEIVWTMQPTDVLFIGRLFNKGIVDFRRLIALTGSEVKTPGYYPMLLGGSIRELVKNNTTVGKNLRYISGNVLTGTKITAEGHLHAFDNQVTIIPEGTETREFFGWAMPGLGKFSNSRTYFSWLINLFSKKEYVIDARIKGGKRAMIMSNEYDKVFPMDILPEYLIKAIIAFDIDKMENLGIYEVAPEDFALCEFVDTSKIELQSIVRKGLDLLYKEMS